MQKHPLFQHTDVTRPLDEERNITTKRMYAMFNENFLPVEKVNGLLLQNHLVRFNCAKVSKWVHLQKELQVLEVTYRLKVWVNSTSSFQNLLQELRDSCLNL